MLLMAHTERPVKTAGAGVFLELRKRLQSGLLIIRKDVVHNSSDVIVTGGDSTLYVRAPEVDLSLALPEGVAFEPGSVVPTSAGEHSEEELHFRLRLSASQHKEASDKVIETLRAKETYCFHCQGCMSRLLEDRLFQRVLPLPNGNWNAIVDEWCCHPDPFANKKLLPRAEDCLLGDTFLLLARDGSCEHTLTEEMVPVGNANSLDSKKPCRRLKVISCKSCSLELGEAVAPETLKLYVTQVIVERAVGDRIPDSLKRSLFLERVVADRLYELSNSLSTFHFCVQTPDGKAFLLIWLLNSDSIVASVPWSHIKPEGSDSDPLDPSLSVTRALKLLYISCSDTGIQQREILTNWETNSVGHALVLPVKVCEELQRVMDESNATLPLSLRCMQSYQKNPQMENDMEEIRQSLNVMSGDLASVTRQLEKLTGFVEEVKQLKATIQEMGKTIIELVLFKLGSRFVNTD